MATSARAALDALNKKYGVSNSTSTSVKNTSNTSRNSTTSSKNTTTTSKNTTTTTNGSSTKNDATSAMDKLREKYGEVKSTSTKNDTVTTKKKSDKAYENTRFYNQGDTETSDDVLSRIVKSSYYNTKSALQGIDAQITKGQAELGSEYLAPTEAMVEERKQADKASKKKYIEANETAQKAEDELNAAKEGKGKVAQFAIDLARGATDLLTDAAVGAVTGGVGSLASLGTRAFGNAMVQAMGENPNADWQEVGTYGLGSAAVEVATEKLFGAAFKGIYGVGKLDKVVDRVMSKIGSTPKGVQMFLTIAKDFAEEGTEEAISDAVNPLIKSIYNDKTVGKNYKDLKASDVLYDYLVGGTLGAIGGGTQLIGSANATNRADTTTTAQNGVNAENTVNPTTNTATQENATQTAQQTSAVENMVSRAATGESISNNMAESLIRDGVSLNELGIDTNGKSMSQLRKEVKAAIVTRANLASTSNNVNTQTSNVATEEATPTDVNNSVATEETTSTNVNNSNNTTANVENEELPKAEQSTGAAKEGFTMPKETETKVSQSVDTTEVLTDERAKAMGLTDENLNAQIDELKKQLAAETDALKREQIREQLEEVHKKLRKVREAYNEHFKHETRPEENGLKQARENLYYEVTNEDGTTETKFIKDVDKEVYDRVIAELKAEKAWDAEEIDMAKAIENELQARKLKGEISTEEFVDFLETFAEHRTTAAQALQALSKYSDNFNENGGISEHEAWKVINNSNLDKESKEELFNKILEYDAKIKKNAGKTNNLIDIIVEIANQRGTLNNVVGKHNDNLEQAVRKNLEAMSAEDLQQFAYNSSAALVYDVNKATLGRKIKSIQILNMLSSPRTAMRNIAGNLSFYQTDMMSMRGAAIVDMAVSRATGTRSVPFENSPLSKRVRSAIHKGIQYSLAEITLDVDMGARSRYDDANSTSRTFKADHGFLENVGTKIERNSDYALVTTDEAFKSATKAIAVQIQNMIDAEQIITSDPDYASKFAQQLALERTFQNNSAISAGIQGGHDLLNALVGVGNSGKNYKNTKMPIHDFGLGDIAAPFTKVAGNLVNVSIMYSPVNVVKGAYEITRSIADSVSKPDPSAKAMGVDTNKLIEQREELQNALDNARSAKERRPIQEELDKVNKKIDENTVLQSKGVTDLARGMNGSLLALVGLLAAKSGILKRADDEDDEDVKNLNTVEGISGMQINMDAFKRWIDGDTTEWKVGDELLDISALEPLNFIYSLGAEMAKDNEEDTNIVSRVTEDMVSSFANSSSELPIVSNFADFIKDTTVYDKDVLPSLAAAAGKTAVSSVTPNILAAIVKGLDDKSRSTTSSDDIGQQIIDTAKSRLPYLRQTLPTKTNALGEEQKPAGNDVQRFLNAVINPLGVNEYNQSDVSKEMERVREETGSATFYPTTKVSSNMSYTDDDDVKHEVTLDYEQKQQYIQVRGRTQMTITNGMITNSKYKNSDADTQAELLDTCYSYAQQVARGSIFGSDAMNSWVKNSQTSQTDLGISQTDYLYYYNKFKNDDVSGNILVGTSYDKTCRMVKAGMTIDEYADMNSAMKNLESVKKQDVVNYLNSTGKSTTEKRALFTAWNSKWKNPY